MRLCSPPSNSLVDFYLMVVSVFGTNPTQTQDHQWEINHPSGTYLDPGFAFMVVDSAVKIKKFFISSPQATFWCILISSRLTFFCFLCFFPSRSHKLPERLSCSAAHCLTHSTWIASSWMSLRAECVGDIGRSHSSSAHWWIRDQPGTWFSCCKPRLQPSTISSY